MRTPLCLVLVLLLLMSATACDEGEQGCLESGDGLVVELGYQGMGEWLPIEDGDDVLVSPGSQGWGLMVEVNIRISGLSPQTGAYSTAEIDIFRNNDARDRLTAEGARVLAALCQEDGSLLSRNRRIEFSENHMNFDELEGIDEGFDASLEIRVEFNDGTVVSQQLDVHLYREPGESDGDSSL